jgi:hypothetical protein
VRLRDVGIPIQVYDEVMKYFPLLYQLQAEKRYLIWSSDEEDSVAVEADGFVPSFHSLSVLRQYADLNHYRLEGEKPLLHDLDWVNSWRTTRTGPVDCEKALAAWNLFGDVATSIPNEGVAFKEIDSQLTSVYRKVFWGNNLPSITPEGNRYIPEWSLEEINSLAGVLTAGLNLFTSRVRIYQVPQTTY